MIMMMIRIIIPVGYGNFFLSSLAVLAEGENEGGRCAGKERIDRRVLYILRFSVRKK